MDGLSIAGGGGLGWMDGWFEHCRGGGLGWMDGWFEHCGGGGGLPATQA